MTRIREKREIVKTARLAAFLQSMRRTRSRKKWEYTKACVRCAVHYGMLDSDMRKQLGIKS